MIENRAVSAAAQKEPTGHRRWDRAGQGTPDTLTANVWIEFSAPEATTAMYQTSQRPQAVINARVNAGVDRNDISTTQVTLAPQFAGPDNPGKSRDIERATPSP